MECPWAEHRLCVPGYGHTGGRPDCWRVHRLDIAEAAAERVLSSPYATPIIAVLARMGPALLGAHRGDMAAAGEQYASPESVRVTMVFGGLVASTGCWFSWLRPWATTTKPSNILRTLWPFAARLDTDPSWPGHAAITVILCWRGRSKQLPYGRRPALRQAQGEAGPSLPARGEPVEPRAPADRAKAMSLLDESLRISRELGMRPLMERVLSQREILKA